MKGHDLQGDLSGNGRTQPARARNQNEVLAISRLFNPLDSSPFRERDIAEDAERFIVDWARELPRGAPLQIVIQVPPEEGARPEIAAISKAVANYFESRARQLGSDMRELFRIGWRSLLIGVAVLTASLVASQMLAPTIPQPTLARLVEESLILVGWVANWRPIEIYLYDWWPILRRRRLYRRISRAPVVVRVQLWPSRSPAETTR